jgi:hypothetical protein
MVIGKMVADTLPEYFQQFSDMLDLFAQHLPFPLPLAATFREGMTDTLKGQLNEVQGYKNPISQSDDNDVQMQQLMRLKLLAVTAEKQSPPPGSRSDYHPQTIAILAVCLRLPAPANGNGNVSTVYAAKPCRRHGTTHADQLR